MVLSGYTNDACNWSGFNELLAQVQTTAGYFVNLEKYDDGHSSISWKCFRTYYSEILLREGSNEDDSLVEVKKIKQVLL